MLLRKGKVKEVHSTDDGNLEFVFTDNISVFDKIIPNQIPGKGEVLCRASTYWLKETEGLGISTHFIEQTASNRMKVRKMDVITDYSRINGKTENYVVPLEFIARYYIAGSLYDRIRSGQLPLESLGFEETPEYGERLPEPIFEVTTKFEAHDRKVETEEALQISGLSEEELEAIKQTVFKIDAHIENSVVKRGLIHVDGKKEFALGEGREVMLIDNFGTPDEDRWWDIDLYRRKEFTELSKEFVRQYYRRISYHEQLTAARNNNVTEPEIPPLPQEMVQQCSDLYIDLYERITGLSF